MELPDELKEIIDDVAKSYKINELKIKSEELSKRYRSKLKNEKKALQTETEAVAYAVARMPATYAAVYFVILNMLQVYNERINTVIDAGAGTGAGSFAIRELINFENLVCLERESSMHNIGEKIMKKSSKRELKNATWEKRDLVKNDISEKADLVISSYVLNELNETERINVLKKLYEAVNKVLVIVEPGTPEGFEEIKMLREWLINNGASIIAPCTHNNKCPLENDWCNATCRVARSKLHKMFKNGEAPFEDEKFSYIVACKEKIDIENKKRIIRHPKIGKGMITLKLCSKDGIEELTITKKNKELYKDAKKLNNGSLISL